MAAERMRRVCGLTSGLCASAPAAAAQSAASALVSARHVAVRGPVDPAHHVVVPFAGRGWYQQFRSLVRRGECPLLSGHSSGAKTSSAPPLTAELQRPPLQLSLPPAPTDPPLTHR